MPLKKPVLLIAVTLTILFSACKKDGNASKNNNTVTKKDTTPIVKPGTDVYVTGNINDANSNSLATCWHNGKAIILADSTVNSYASGIAVKDTDVYIVGSIAGAATIWKNGVASTLAGGNQANAVTVGGDDIYAVGGTYVDNVYYGCYWKNGTKVVINDAMNVLLTAISVIGNDVYVAGNAYLPTGFTAVKYWKNAADHTILQNDPQNPPIYFSGNVGLGVSGTDVYVTGDVQNAAGDHVIATYWKNGTAVPLIADQDRSSTVNNISIINTDIYATGNYDYFAMYWLNGVGYKLNDGTQQYTATAITVNNKDIYVAGFAGYSTTNAVYWKNGNLVKISSRNSVTTGIGVVNRN